MSLKSMLASLGIAVAMIAGTAIPALAAAAVADTNLNVRSCGSTDCRVVDVLRRGEVVDVEFCEDLWCRIEKRGRDGWVSARFLSRDGYYDDDDYYDDDEPVIYIEPRRRRIPRPDPFTVCLGGQNARFCVYD